MKSINPILIATLILSFILGSCTENDTQPKEEESSSIEGIIHFRIEYPFIDTSQGLLNSIVPRKLDFYIKDGKFTSRISRGRMFSMLMIGKPEQDYLALGLEFGTENIMAELSGDEIQHFKEDQPHLKFNPTDETKEMAGFLCHKTEATYQMDSVTRTFDVWYTKEIEVMKNCNWFTPYDEIDGVLLEYEFEQYGLRMKIIAETFEKVKVNDAQFEIDNKFKNITFNKFDERMHELFDRFNH